jgi:uncharacterized protein (TIGR00730 family)
MKWNKSKEEIRANDLWNINKVQSQMISGFDKLTDIGACITIFGSARLKETDPYYKLIEEIAFKFSEKGYGIITGGGPGLMTAANKGAKEGGSPSVGIGIKLPFEQGNNSYIDYDKNLTFDSFYIRKVMMIKYSQCFVIGGAGFGTLDELFELLTLQSTLKIDKFPIYLVGSQYWKGLVDWLRNTVLEKGCISESDLELFRIVDTADEIISSFDKFFVKYRKENKLNF